MYHCTMAQVSKFPLKKAIYSYINELFFDTIVLLSDKKRVDEFLQDFLTPVEKIMLTKRMAIYVLLGKGYTFREIKKILNVSPSTIANAARNYKYLGKGSRGMVKEIMEDEKHEVLWSSVAEFITSAFKNVRKGSGVWRYLHQEIKNNKYRKPLG